jgi:small redox-active disulfide protein 2
MTEIRQVTVKGHRIGLVGLDEVFDQVRSQEFASEEDLAQALVELLSARNYVPEASREDYAKALLREFKVAQGEAADDAAGEGAGRGLMVRVYGPGCANCERLAAEAISALAELNLDADFEHVKDMNEIGALGPVGMPALSINGKIVAAGRVLRREKIMELLREASE